MCGIAGMFSEVRKTDDLLAIVDSMLKMIEHRGPDELGVSSPAKNVSLGMVRLTILDQIGGRQPMASPCDSGRYELVFNGEIYNHLELRQELKKLGHNFISSHSDTETILHSFEQWREKCFIKFNGMFSIAIWDKQRNELILARDRFGEKPLYYAKNNQEFIFASEIKSIVSKFPGLKKLNNANIFRYLEFGYGDPNATVFEGVEKLLPGYYAIIKSDFEINIENFFALEDHLSINHAVPNLQDFESLLRGSVKERLVADAPVGIFLSGGLDSSTVAYFANELNPNISAFSVGFELKNYDESFYSRLVAKHLNIPHFVNFLSETDAISLMAKLPMIFDEPVSDPSIIPTTFLCQFASKHVKVALGGDGSDEIMFGYRSIKALKLYYSELGNIAKFIGNHSRHFGKLIPSEISRKLHRLVELENRPVESQVDYLISPFSAELSRNLSKRKLDSDLTSQLNASKKHFSEASREDQWRFSYLTGYLPEDILVKTDRASMYASLEVRSPFLDNEFANYCLSLNFGNHYKSGIGKQILRKIMVDRLPKEILNRKKQGFGVPLDHWFRGEFGKTYKNYFLEGAFISDYVNPNYLRETYLSHITGKANNANVLFGVLQLQLWLEKWSSND